MSKSIEEIDKELSELHRRCEEVADDLGILLDYEEEPEIDHDQELSEEYDYLSRKINELNNQKENLQRLDIQKQHIKQDNDSFENIKKSFKRGEIKSDKETNNDKVGRGLYAKVIGEYIVSKRTEVPFNIGVFGRWGEGKSSFLKMIEDQIHLSNSNIRPEMSYRTHIVKYDATEYSEKNKIWACILKELYTKFEEDKGEFGRLKFFLYRFWNKAKEKKWAYGINVLIFVITVFFGIVVTNSIEASKLKETIISSTLGIVPLILTIINIVIPVIKGQLKLAKPIANYVTSNMTYPSYDDELGKKENLKEDLNDLLDVWLDKNERIVIFVDEIDRCSDKGIIELLESLQLFLKVKDIVIVMAIDVLVKRNCNTRV